MAPFAHEALLYSGDQAYLDGVVPFIREGLERGQPTLVMVPAPRIDLIWEALGGQGGGVGPEGEGLFVADMRAVGANPALIIPAWEDFLRRSGAGGLGVRGVGEPIWAGRTGEDLVECQRHEALINLAFAGATGLTILCPYDADALPAEVIEEARRSHPVVVDEGSRSAAADYRGAVDHAPPLPEPAAPDLDVSFVELGLPSMLAGLRGVAMRAGLEVDQVEDLGTAVGALAHAALGGGRAPARLRTWNEGRSLIVEIAHAGRLDDPLADRRRAGEGMPGALWEANHLCDLVQVRSGDPGTVVRLHSRRRARPGEAGRPSPTG